MAASLCTLTFTAGLTALHAQEPAPAPAAKPKPAKIDGYLEFNYGEESKNRDAAKWVQSIRVTSPAYRSEVKGNVTVQFHAPGMKVARALCWRQPDEANPSPWGHDVDLTAPNGPASAAAPTPAAGITLNDKGEGSFVFPADTFPNGPVTIRILAYDGQENNEGKRDICELQLFNIGGIKWNQGIPAEAPPAAKGLQLIFSDDFNGPLSISNDGRGTTYNAHKPRFGDFSGWQFSDVLGEGKPFSQVGGTYLKISARKDTESPRGRSGLIATVDMDGKGIWAKAPAYLECRFTAQSAPGTWPAFWTITDLDRNSAGDELDIIEAYGGMGKKNPNHPGYSIVSHFWGQKNADGTPKKGVSTRVPIMDLGGKSYWSTTFHTYGVYIGLKETIYYFDNIEVLRHPTNDVSRDRPHCVLINYAIGGISRWPIDLARYGDGTDMYVDFLRIYAEKPVDYVQPPKVTEPKP
ncbi:MAG: family 16 glycosylhydrolase [Candidatus Methylacidiphilales bacterium]